MKLVKFVPKTAKILAVAMASTLALSAMIGNAQAEVNVADVQGCAEMMKQAANNKNMEQVAKLIADDAIISITRNGKSGTMDKKTYLQRLKDNWQKSSEYNYNIKVDNVVTMGEQAKADLSTVETFTKDGKSVKLVTNSRATLTSGADNAVLLKLVSQITIE